MGIHLYGPCAALALSVATVLACASEDHHPAAPLGVTNAQPSAPTVQDQGWAVLVEADRQVNELEQLHDSTADPYLREAMTRQIEDLRARSNRLLDQMTIGDGRVHDVSIRADVENLQRTISAAANTERQAEPEAESPRAR
jgi:hypothetical protein